MAHNNMAIIPSAIIAAKISLRTERMIWMAERSDLRRYFNYDT